MSSIRAMEAGDAERVASLVMRILRRKDMAPTPALVHYIRSFYCDGPFREPDLPSLVRIGEDGRIIGFVGVHAVPLLWGGRRLRAAFCGSLMVENHQASPLAGAGLLKAFLAGPQDVSVSETANTVAQAMWERLRGQVLAPNSLEWIRVLRPAGFGLAIAWRKRPLLRAALGPFAHAADRFRQRRSPKSGLAQFLPEPGAGGAAAQAVDRQEFAALLPRFTEAYAVRPDWSGGYGAHVLDQALDKPEFGAPVMAAVRVRGADPAGVFLYHAAPGGVGRVLQVLAAPGRMGAVLPALFADALARGAVGLRGRAEPAILQAAPGRSIAFATVASTVVHARDPALLAALQRSDALVNGLAGETWCRLFGGALS